MSLTRAAERSHSKGFSTIIGIDEAGRGPLAGPVVAASCSILENIDIDGIYDSKKTTESHRETMYDVLTNHPSVVWAVSIVSNTEIDEVNILQATMLGMKRSLQTLLSENKSLNPEKCIALVDGNRLPQDLPIEAKFIIKGDGSIFSIAAASIIAKVTRDRIMVEMDKKYPLYKLAQHKGYPTFEHRSLLMQHGISDIHRLSYGPVKKAQEAHGNKDKMVKVKITKVSKITKKIKESTSLGTSKTVVDSKKTKIEKKKDVKNQQNSTIIEVRRSERVRLKSTTV